MTCSKAHRPSRDNSPLPTRPQPRGKSAARSYAFIPVTAGCLFLSLMVAAATVAGPAGVAEFSADQSASAARSCPLCGTSDGPDEPGQPGETERTDPAARSEDQQRMIRILQPLAGLVGSWRGVGQPQRGSSRGAWTEESSVAWRFHNQQVALVFDSQEGQLFDVLRFEADSAGHPMVVVTLADGSEVRCALDADASEPGRHVFLSEETQLPQYRCTVRQLSEIRATVLLESRTVATGGFRRLAEVGYTRAGERLARSGAGEKQCIVTGGLGTISVMFEGKTYYVCCEGCQQAFDADPAGTIADYRKRMAAEHSPSRAEK